MCGRYVIARAVGDLLGGVELDESLENYNVAPTHTVPILVDHPDDDGAWSRQIHAARWGLLPRWAKDESFSSRAFNARSETVTEKPTFRHAVKAQHCAVPASGYYEWLKTPAGKGAPAKTPYFIHPRDEKETIYFAGLYEWWKIPEGEQAGQWLLSTTILTMASPEEHDADRADGPGAETLRGLAGLHDRLPIPLDYRGSDDDGLTTWLRSTDEAEAAVERVRQDAYRVASGWTLREVGPEVGNVANQGPHLIEPVERLI